jgi:NAD(P)H dehydrogenase (quinone)
MILVTGSTGTFGSHVIKALQNKKINFKAAAQSIEKVKQAFGEDVPAAEFNWKNKDTFNGLFNGITGAFIISPSASSTFHQEIVPLLEEAKKARLPFIVLVTVFGADANKEGAHYLAEELVKNSGIPYTILRPNFIFQNFINYDLEAVKSGSIYLPTGNGKTSYVDVRDVANVVAAIFSSPEQYKSNTFTLTGSEAISHAEAAAIFSEVLERPVINVDPSEAEYKKTLLSFNLPAPAVDFFAQLYSYIKAGYCEAITNDLETITGEKPTSFKTFVTDYRSVFK